MIRRLAAGLLLLLLIVLSGLVVGCEEELPDGAIAQVGQKFVSQEQLDGLEATYVMAGKAPDKATHPSDYLAFKQKLVEYLVTMEIMRQQAPEYNVTITSSDVEARLAQIKQMFLDNEEKFQGALEQLDLTLEQLSAAIRESLWFEKMQAAVTEGISVAEEEVRAYYDEHKSEYIEQESRAVRHILISPYVDAAGNMITSTPTQEDWDAAKAEAEQVRSKILNGEDFVTAVETYSDDELSIEDGGDLGAVIRGQTNPAFEEAVFSLQKNKLSEPVKTPSGYHLIEVTDITPEVQLSYDLVKEKIRSMLLAAKQEATWKQWLAKKTAELGVVYRDGYAPPATVTTSPEDETAGEEPGDAESRDGDGSGDESTGDEDPEGDGESSTTEADGE